MFNRNKTYTFPFNTPFKDVVNFDPYKTHKLIAKNLIAGVAFIAVEIAINTYVPYIPAPAFQPDPELIRAATKAFKVLKSVGL